MKRLTVIALLLVGCGGSDGDWQAAFGVDAGAPAATVDAQPASPCVPPYEQRHYYPMDDVYCGPTNATVVENPCIGSIPIGWCGEGVIHCGKPDGGTD